MASPQWLQLSAVARKQAHSLLLHCAADTATLHKVLAVALNVPALLRSTDANDTTG